MASFFKTEPPWCCLYYIVISMLWHTEVLNGVYNMRWVELPDDPIYFNSLLYTLYHVNIHNAHYLMWSACSISTFLALPSSFAHFFSTADPYSGCRKLFARPIYFLGAGVVSITLLDWSSNCTRRLGEPCAAARYHISRLRLKNVPYIILAYRQT